MEYNEIIAGLKKHANPKNIEGMARFGISKDGTLGVSVPHLRSLAKKIGKDHELALKLWASGIHEARLLASMVDNVHEVSEKQMDSWIKDFDSWDVCDQTCMNLFDKTPFAFKKAVEWASRQKEFEKRAGFALMAAMSVHIKHVNDERFLKFLPIIKRESHDERNYVRKAVNWALRQIGKRSEFLKKKAIKTASEILKQDSKAAKWIAGDALRELRNHNSKR